MDELELNMLGYVGLLDEYVFTLEDEARYVARLVARVNIAPQYDVFLPSGARYGRVTLPSGLPDVEIYLLGYCTWLDARSYRG